MRARRAIYAWEANTADIADTKPAHKRRPSDKEQVHMRHLADTWATVGIRKSYACQLALVLSTSSTLDFVFARYILFPSILRWLHTSFLFMSWRDIVEAACNRFFTGHWKFSGNNLELSTQCNVLTCPHLIGVEHGFDTAYSVFSTVSSHLLLELSLLSLLRYLVSYYERQRLVFVWRTHAALFILKPSTIPRFTLSAPPTEPIPHSECSATLQFFFCVLWLEGNSKPTKSKGTRGTA